MCGRYWLSDNPETLCRRYNAVMADLDGYNPSGEVFPSEIVPVVVGNQNRMNRLRTMRWGFPGFENRGIIINARAETVDTKYMFRKQLVVRRCIVPVNGFFEWKKEGREKIKYRINIRGHDLFSLAGIYDIFTDKRGDEYASFVIITTSPLPIIRSIHDRMPVILPPEKEAGWLDSSLKNVHLLKGYLQPDEIAGLTVEKSP
ncbi:MAG: SOS response-associated peptidase [Dethiobacteria bacterium]